MSLTRNDWVELWEDVKLLEKELKTNLTSYDKSVYKHIIYRTKQKIESVIGQME